MHVERGIQDVEHNVRIVVTSGVRQSEPQSGAGGSDAALYVCVLRKTVVSAVRLSDGFIPFCMHEPFCDTVNNRKANSVNTRQFKKGLMKKRAENKE